MSDLFSWRRFKPILKLLLIVLLLGFAVYWVRFSPVSVRAHQVKKGSVANRLLGTGTLEARVRAGISPKISGLLVEVAVDQGDQVRKGQLLAKLDDVDFRHQVAIAKADLAASKATIKRIESEIASAQASAVKAKENFERVSILLRSQAVAQNEMERAIEARDVAEANLNRAISAKIEAERVSDKAEASLLFYNSRLMDTMIRAPFDGLVVMRNRNPGDVVVPGGVILDLISTEQLWISAWVDETAMSAIEIGQRADIIFRSSGSVVPGKVVRLGAETDRETREFIVDVEALALPEKWAIGQRAEVFIETARHDNVIFIPQNLVIWRYGVPGVLIDSKGKAKWQEISLGLRDNNNVEITAGLKPDDIVLGALPGKNLPREGRAVRHDKI